MLWIPTIVGWGIFALWVAGAVPATVSLLRRRLGEAGSAERGTGNAEQGERSKNIADTPPFSHAPSSRHSPFPAASSPLRVSVIVPARDEAATIEQTLRSLLASAGVALEVIAVDDRSTDSTGAIMDRLAADDARLRVIHIRELPNDWLGKNHAMQAGSQAATGQWLLFTDGDILFTPDVIRRAVDRATVTNLDHLCLVPQMESGGYWETALTTYFGLIFVMGAQTWLVPTSYRGAYVGVGAFNLVRRSAYDSFGGHVPIRLDVLDDVKLGKLVKQSGLRSDVLMAREQLSVRWQPSAWGVIRGLEKNAFASQRYSLGRLCYSTAVFAVMFVAPYAGMLLFPDVRGAGFASAAVLAHVLYGGISSAFGGGWRVLPALPVVSLLMIYAFWRSAVITLRQGGVRWRETFYPLELLRQNLYR